MDNVISEYLELKLQQMLRICSGYKSMITVVYPIGVASFTKGVNWRLAKCPLKTNRRLANHQLTYLVKEATEEVKSYVRVQH